MYMTNSIITKLVHLQLLNRVKDLHQVDFYYCVGPADVEFHGCPLQYLHE